MNQSIRVEKAQKSKRLIALAIDLIIMAISTVALFFVMLYGVIGPMFNYKDRVNLVKEYRDQYELNYQEGEEYEVYEAVVKKFYFEYFTDDIIKTIETNYPNEHYESITNIYNVYVYNLPYAPTPTGDNYKSDLFEYQIDKETGVVLKNVLGVKRSDLSGKAYERYLKELMFSKYNQLGGFLIDYKPEYKEAVTYKNNIELSSRTVAAGLSIIIFATIIPLCLKNAQMLGDKIEDVAYVTDKGGFKIKPYHTILRGSLFYLLPLIGVALLNKYSVIALIIFPIFITCLLILFRNTERDLRDLMSGTLAVDKKNSLIFKSAGEARLYEKKEENQVIEDKEYLERLQNASKVELETSRDEQFKNRNKEK